MVKKEKYVNWKGISIPEVYFEQIVGYLKHSKRFSSVSEFVRVFMDKKLKRFLEEIEK